jgi:hypothetical protein
MTRWSRTASRSAPGAANVVLEGECKAMSGIHIVRATERWAAAGKTPEARVRAPRSWAALGSQSTSYLQRSVASHPITSVMTTGGHTYAEGRHNTAEGQGEEPTEGERGNS